MKHFLAGFLLTFAVAATAHAATVDGVGVADSVPLDGTTLVLNGAGKRTKYFFNVYVAALYLQARSHRAAAVLADTGPKRLSMTLMRHLSANQLIDALREGLAHNSTPAELARVRPQSDALAAIMAAIGGADTGDVLTIDFLPDGSTRVGRNGRPQGGPIPGRDFQRALLQVWLGPHPVQADLKDELLSR